MTIAIAADGDNGDPGAGALGPCGGGAVVAAVVAQLDERDGRHRIELEPVTDLLALRVAGEERAEAAVLNEEADGAVVLVGASEPEPRVGGREDAHLHAAQGDGASGGLEVPRTARAHRVQVAAVGARPRRAVVHEVANDDGAEHVGDPAHVVVVNVRDDDKVQSVEVVGTEESDDRSGVLASVHEHGAAFRGDEQGGVALADVEEAKLQLLGGELSRRGAGGGNGQRQAAEERPEAEAPSRFGHRRSLLLTGLAGKAPRPRRHSRRPEPIEQLGQEVRVGAQPRGGRDDDGLPVALSSRIRCVGARAAGGSLGTEWPVAGRRDLKSQIVTSRLPTPPG